MSEQPATYLAERPHASFGPSRLPYLEACPGWVSDGAPGPLAERGTRIGERLAAYLVDGTDPRYQAPYDWLDAIDAGMRQLDAIRAAWPDVVWSAEDRIATSVPDVWGYADLIGRDELLGDTALVELKTGRGQRAPAAHNRQLQALALGLLEAGADAVHAYLIECDRDSVSEALFTDPKPLKSAVKALVLNATYATEQDLHAGPQCRYCARHEQCPACVAAPGQALEAIGERTLAPHDYALALSPEALGETLARIAPLVALAEHYLGALQARAMALMEAGAEVPGWTIRHSNGARSWGDEDGAVAALQEAGLDLAAVMDLATPAQVERRLGKAAARLVAPYCVSSIRKSLVEALP